MRSFSDFNAELHARPSIYFDGPAFVEHVAIMRGEASPLGFHDTQSHDADVTLRVERHTEFVTVTRLRKLTAEASEWQASELSDLEVLELTGIASPKRICRVSILVVDKVSADISSYLSSFSFGDTAVSSIGGGSAQICSDFKVMQDGSSRILMLNRELNARRLGRMVRRIFEIETYRTMALLGLPVAQSLAPMISDYDRRLIELTNRNLQTPSDEHKGLLADITVLASQIISATSEVRHRFSATAAYTTIVEERIASLRETHVPGFQRYGTFVERRFKPAVRTCQATALRLEQLSQATTHLINLLQTRIQVEIEHQNAVQIRAMAERAATQVKIQRAVEGFSIIAISYYLLNLLKVTFETADHAGYHIDPMVMLIAIPIVIGTVCLTILRVKQALNSEH